MTSDFQVSWRTISVTALPPGWQNVYKESDESVLTTPCPALLLQEECLVVNGGRMIKPVRAEDSFLPDTRVVYACGNGREGDEIVAACDLGNYIGTVSPDVKPITLLRGMDDDD